MEVTLVLTEKEIRTIQDLSPEEQSVVMSLVNSFRNPKEMNDMQKFLKQARKECLLTNPMDMEEIDKVIHEGN